MDTFRARTLLCAAACALLLPAAGRAGNWPGWRGPTGLGYTDANNLPLSWGGKKAENILWTVQLTYRGYSSPVVWGNNVFVTGTKPQTDAEVKSKAAPEHHVTCYQAATGKRMWDTHVPAGPFRTDNYAVPTPATDGRRVFAWFGSAVLAALDVQGKLLWHKEFPANYSLNPAMSSSPVLHGDLVILLADQGDASHAFLRAFDKKTGNLIWEQKRPTANCNNATPFVIDVKGKPELIVGGARDIDGYDPATGKLLWLCATSGFVPSPAYGSGLLYADNGVDGPGVAVDPTGRGDVSKTHVKWRIPKVDWSYASPIVVNGHLYRSVRPGILKCWDMATGKLVYAERLQGLTEVASPVATPDGRIYFASPARTYVIQAGPRLKLLATNTIEGGGDEGPSPAVAGGRIFLKTTSRLWCVGRK
jgi:outer membrane protein assembly factor BamB